MTEDYTFAKNNKLVYDYLIERSSKKEPQGEYELLNILRLTVLILLIPALIPAQESEKDSELITRDISGYRCVGRAANTDKKEALRLAKADALNSIFNKTGKDKLFRDLFISSWPEYISVEESKVAREDGLYMAEVKVFVDQNAMILTEDSYRMEAENLLNGAEEKIDEAEQLLKEAENSEANLRMSEAFILYGQARVRLREVGELLRFLGDVSVKSTKGTTLSTVLSLAGALELRVSSGLVRLEALAKESEKDRVLAELDESFDLIIEEFKKLEETVESNSEIEPFYDLPKTQLNTILIELNGSLEKEGTIKMRLLFLQSRVPEEKILLKDRIDIALTDIETLGIKLEKMKEEVELEIAEPRLKRQEKARRKAERRRKIKETASYIFLHKPAQALTFHYTLPFEWDGESGIARGNESNWWIRAEGAFDMGFWIRGLLEHDEIDLDGGHNASLRSEIGIGFFRKTLLGAGFGWEWIKKVNDEKSRELKEKSLKFFLGRVNKERNRVDWLLSFKYRIPLVWDEIIAPYHMNMSVEWLLRAADILLVEAAISTGCYPLLPLTDTDQLTDHLAYLFSWKAAIALRVPNPFTWGFFYRGYRQGHARGGDLGELSYRGRWGCFIEYSF